MRWNAYTRMAYSYPHPALPRHLLPKEKGIKSAATNPFALSPSTSSGQAPLAEASGVGASADPSTSALRAYAQGERFSHSRFELTRHSSPRTARFAARPPPWIPTPQPPHQHTL